MHCLRQLDDHREHYIIYSYSTHCLRQCHLLIAYHLSCNSPSISIWLAVFSPSASGRCTGGIFSQSGRTHNFHHICCLAALTALKPGPNYKGRAKNRSILQFCLSFRHQCVYLSSVKSFEAIKCGGIQW